MCPEDLAVDILKGVWDVLVCLLNDIVYDRRASTGCLGIVGDGGDGSDEGHQNVEEAFLLLKLDLSIAMF